MATFEEIEEKDKKDWIDVRIRVPKNTICFIVNYLEQRGDVISLGNLQYDVDDIKNNKIDKKIKKLVD